MLFALTVTLAILGRWRHLTLPITNQTKLTITIALTLNDTVMQTNKTKLTLTVTLTPTYTVMVIFYVHFVESNKKVVLQ